MACGGEKPRTSAAAMPRQRSPMAAEAARTAASSPPSMPTTERSSGRRMER